MLCKINKSSLERLSALQFKVHRRLGDPKPAKPTTMMPHCPGLGLSTVGAAPLAVFDKETT